MTLGQKLVASFLGCGLIPLAVVAVTSYTTANNGMHEIEHNGATDLEQKAYNQLVALRDVKRQQLERYFDERQGDMQVLVENVKVLRQNAFDKLATVQELKRAQLEKFFEGVQSDLKTLAQSAEVGEAFAAFEQYRAAQKTGADAGLDTATEDYEAVWSKFNPLLAEYVNSHGYYDLFLINAKQGQVVYTAARESDLGANLAAGPLKDEGLAKLWRGIRKQQEIMFQDFTPYTPSNGQYAGFVGAPYFDDGGDLVGVIALQIPTDPINEIVQRRDGMGQTGETYLVGALDGHYAFRSDMLTMGDGEYVMGREIHTEYIDDVLANRQPIRSTYTDSAGNPVMIAADPLDIPGLNWACISKINLEEAIVLQAEDESEDFLTKYNNAYGYYDLFLLNSDGYCFYSVCHEADYHTNLASGEYRDSGLGKLTRQVLQSKSFGFADFEPYAPSAGAPAAFIAEPVVLDGKVELVVALQMPLDAINAIMGVRAGMGETGETYLVGPDKLMRSDSFLDPENHTVAASFANPQAGSVDTEAAEAALNGQENAKIITDYNGNPVLSAYAPINVFGTRWALLAEIDESEAMAAVHAMQATSQSAQRTMQTWMGIIGAIAAVLVAIVGVTFARSISKPINRIIAGLTEGAAQVNDASCQVSSASQQLAEGSSEQAASLEETSSALEQMAAMTRTNAENANKANGLSTEAREAANTGDATMGRLNSAMEGINESSDKISKIIKVQEEIAFQTNLLALNAAVEAARAGEHGKGFAVVAGEVRNLAQRAAQAARETTDLIEDSVNRAREGSDVAGEVGKSLSAIVGDVGKVTELINGIAKASEQQAQGVEQVNTAVSQMDRVTQQNASSAEECASAAEQLAAQSQTVKGMVDELVRVVGGRIDDQVQHTPGVASRAARKQKANPAPANAGARSDKPTQWNSSDDDQQNSDDISAF